MIEFAQPSAVSEDGYVEPSEITMTDIMTMSSSEARAGVAARIRTLLGALAPRTLERRGASWGTREGAPFEMDLRNLSVLSTRLLIGVLPENDVPAQTLRTARLDGPLRALAEALTRSGQLEAERWPNVDVITGRGPFVDVHQTSSTELATGIQRVCARNRTSVGRDHDVLLVAWTRRFHSLRRLTPDEVQWALKGPRTDVVVEKEPGVAFAERKARGEPTADEDVVVPWKCTLLVPELPAEPPRARRYHALAAYSGSTTGVIGYDLVPLTCSETSADGMAEGFALYLSAAARFDRMAVISHAAATEYNGWRQMLSGLGALRT